MDIETYHTYCLSKNKATESFPFPSLPDVLVFKVGGKMFTATNITTFGSISVKCDPDVIEDLRSIYPSFIDHSYFSKKHWGNVLMDNTISDKLIFEWIDNSYNLVVSSLTKKVRLELGL